MQVGADGSRLPLLLSALADGLRQHKANTEKDAPPDGAEGEDDEEEDVRRQSLAYICVHLLHVLLQDEEELFTEASLAQLQSIFAAIKVSQYAPKVGSAMRNLKKKQKAILSEFGLA